MKYVLINCIIGTFIVCSGVLFTSPVVAQDTATAPALDLPPIDESQFNGSTENGGTEQKTPPPDLGPEPDVETGQGLDLGSEPAFSSSADDAPVQNAIIEGVQLSAEPGDKADEKVVSCYFIFRDKPSSYFYEVRAKEKKIVFEFNDTKASAAPVPSTAEPPITGFTVEQRKVDVNKDVRGLKPEWHTQIRVVFNVDYVPEIHVNDEYNIISFSYKWSTDPNKVNQYVVKDNTKKIMLLSTASVGGIGAGILTWYLFFRPTTPVEGAIDTTDLPSRPKK